MRFHLNGELCQVPPDISPQTLLLDWLRDSCSLTGTKEGCAEGDCGACTVVFEADGARVPANACLMVLGQIHGLRLRTVEGLSAAAAGGAHPVQKAMAACHATQCGFCTPGFVMSGWAYASEGGDLHEALAGNLCRCTGYRPILDAFSRIEREIARPVSPIGAGATLTSGGTAFHRPATLEELLTLRESHPGAQLMGGGTDLVLHWSETRESPDVVLSTQDVAELAVLTAEPAELRVGAAVPYHRLLGFLAAQPGFQPVADLLRRLGSRQIRGTGTLGGNLGTASPIGDALPPLVALGARLRVAGRGYERMMAVENFLTGYRSNALRPNEVIREIRLPRPPTGAYLACEKLSRRYDQDIAALGVSALVRVEGTRIVGARIAHGGLGPRVARCSNAEEALVDKPFAAASFDGAAEALMADVTPLDDLRASAEYRRLAAGNLLRRMWWRWSDADAA